MAFANAEESLTGTSLPYFPPSNISRGPLGQSVLTTLVPHATPLTQSKLWVVLHSLRKAHISHIDFAKAIFLNQEIQNTPPLTSCPELVWHWLGYFYYYFLDQCPR